MKNKGLIIALVATCIAFFIVAQRKKKDAQTDNNGVVGEDINLAGGVETTSDEEGKGKNKKDTEVVVSSIAQDTAITDDIGFLKQEIERKINSAWNDYVDKKKQNVSGQSVRGYIGTTSRLLDFQEYVQNLGKEYGCEIVVRTNGNKITKIKIDF